MFGQKEEPGVYLIIMGDVKLEKGNPGGRKQVLSGSESRHVDNSSEHKECNKTLRTKGRRDMNLYTQRYNYKGENDSIGVILALRTECFNHKEVLYSFTEN